MTATLLLVSLAIVLSISGVAAAAAAVEHATRATAWRQIALERRWNQEQRPSSRGL
jgi:hypothetical protein